MCVQIVKKIKYKTFQQGTEEELPFILYYYYYPPRGGWKAASQLRPR